jgi:hypothetical protein
MILDELPSDDVPDFVQPSLKQSNYADILGLEFTAWKIGITPVAMSRLIEQRKRWSANFQCTCGQMPATGIMKECLRFKQFSFDKNTLTKSDGMKAFMDHTKGARLEQMRILRHVFKIPIDIVVDLTRLQAIKLIERLCEKRDENGLVDIKPLGPDEDDFPANNGAGTYSSSGITSPAKQKISTVDDNLTML